MDTRCLGGLVPGACFGKRAMAADSLAFFELQLETFPDLPRFLV